jgi:hypothetical protein
VSRAGFRCCRNPDEWKDRSAKAGPQGFQGLFGKDERI